MCLLQVDCSGRYLGWVDIDLHVPPIMHNYSACSAKLSPAQGESADSGIVKIKVNQIQLPTWRVTLYMPGNSFPLFHGLVLRERLWTWHTRCRSWDPQARHWQRSQVSPRMPAGPRSNKRCCPVSSTLNVVYMVQAIRDYIKILGHCSVSVCQYVYMCVQSGTISISTVSLINHIGCRLLSN